MAYILADKLLMQKICDDLMQDITKHDNTRDVFSGALGGLTAFDLPECFATRFLIQQLAWELSKHGYDRFCGCAVGGEEDENDCSWCQLFMNGDSGVVKILELMKGSDKAAGEPRMRPAARWHPRTIFRGKGRAVLKAKV